MNREGIRFGLERKWIKYEYVTSLALSLIKSFGGFRSSARCNQWELQKKESISWTSNTLSFPPLIITKVTAPRGRTQSYTKHLYMYGNVNMENDYVPKVLFFSSLLRVSHTDDNLPQGCTHFHASIFGA